jgi:hypothetical protein
MECNRYDFQTHSANQNDFVDVYSSPFFRLNKKKTAAPTAASTTTTTAITIQTIGPLVTGNHGQSNALVSPLMKTGIM